MAILGKGLPMPLPRVSLWRSRRTGRTAEELLPTQNAGRGKDDQLLLDGESQPPCLTSAQTRGNGIVDDGTALIPRHQQPLSTMEVVVPIIILPNDAARATVPRSGEPHLTPARIPSLDG